MIGGADRPDVWDAFQDRFAIPEIGEFYGSTEGNASLINHAVTVADRGACGRQGWLLRRLLGFRLVRFDIERDEPIRGPGGICTHTYMHTHTEREGDTRNISAHRHRPRMHVGECATVWGECPLSVYASVMGQPMLRSHSHVSYAVLVPDTGFCIECGPGEVGELLGPIREDVVTARFEGYTDAKARMAFASLYTLCCAVCTYCSHIGGYEL